MKYSFILIIVFLNVIYNADISCASTTNNNTVHRTTKATTKQQQETATKIGHRHLMG